MLTSGQLTQFRAQSELTMVDLCVVKRPNLTRDDQGDAYPDASPTTIYSGKCHVAAENVQANEVDVGESLHAYKDVTILLPAGTPVAESDTITATIVRPGGPSVVEFEVEGITPQTWEITRQVKASAV